jgi:hypothetical protein
MGACACSEDLEVKDDTLVKYFPGDKKNVRGKPMTVGPSIMQGQNRRRYEGVKLTADFENPKWIERHRHMFHFLDPNKNNKVSLDELIYKASEEICKKIGATPEQTARHSEAVANFFGAAGLKRGEETEWEQYIKGWERLAREELGKWESNEITLIRLWGDALFDIIDKNGDGSISLKEWTLYTKCAGIIATDEDREQTFKICDLDGDGRIDIDEMTRQHVGFWYTADPKSDGLYGKSVP